MTRDRARELMALAKASKACEAELCNQEEIAFVDGIWAKMDSDTCWLDAFMECVAGSFGVPFDYCVQAYKGDDVWQTSIYGGYTAEEALKEAARLLLDDDAWMRHDTRGVRVMHRSEL